MKHKWFYFTPAADGFDVIVRDVGADNGDVLAEGSLRGKDFKQFVDEILFEGLEALKEEEAQKATSKDWVGEPDDVEHERPPTTEEPVEKLDPAPDVVEEVKKGGWFGGKS